MDKTFLIRLNNTYKKIKTQLLLNETIRKYLVYDEIDDDTSVPAIEIAAEHIFLQPIIQVDSAEPFNKKNYITITVPNSDYESNKIDYTIRVIVMCEKNDWDINGDIRPLIIAQEIINELDNMKFELSNPIYFNSMVETVTNKDTTGYSLLFSVVDGVGSNDNK